MCKHTFCTFKSINCFIYCLDYDFNYLNEAADFFVLRLDQMNFCYEDYRNGINILDGDNDEITIVSWT